MCLFYTGLYYRFVYYYYITVLHYLRCLEHIIIWICTIQISICLTDNRMFFPQHKMLKTELETSKDG